MSVTSRLQVGYTRLKTTNRNNPNLFSRLLLLVEGAVGPRIIPDAFTDRGYEQKKFIRENIQLCRESIQLCVMHRFV